MRRSCITAIHSTEFFPARRARDQCIIENGEENCGELIEAHKKCMRDAGFDV
ncbi:unnamed protein product [Haemonchus placei]|uniref:CHCH domain-containing protein n=1 Tax=Haemonchus placei TaxID=6290 RepID=A0A0N4WRC6_HAEPC|nr:unnamed protein product [Haemonchus placei]